ncbi:MAG TPA: hypothetical protein PLB96_07800 [Syntrophales bacterium]|nr:hypothetical protein [Syntrophales bacterium]
MMSEQILSPGQQFPRAVPLSGRNLSRTSLRRAIEQTDWDERILRQENRLNRCCWAAVAAACVCILPFLAASLLS